MKLFILSFFIALQSCAMAQFINPVNFDYSKTDTAFYKVGSDSFDGIPMLVEYINKHVKTDHEKYRIVYLWVRNFVGFSLKARSQNPASIFESKLAYWYGKSILIKELCKQLGIECEIVYGVSKNLLGKQFLNDTISAAWNVVKLYGKTYVSDVFTDAGIFSGKNCCWYSIVDSRFFLITPEESIWYRLPYNKNHQFLKSKISRKEFLNRPCIFDQAEAIQLVSYSPADALVVVKKMEKAWFKFHCKKPIRIVDLEILRVETSETEGWGELIPIDFTNNGDKIEFYWEFEQVDTFLVTIYTDSLETIAYKIVVTE